MKSFVALTIVFAVVSLSMSMSVDERKAMRNKLANECKTKEGGSDADLTELLSYQLPSTPQGKCIHACLGETIGILKDGKVDVNAAVEAAKMAFNGDEKLVNLARDLSTECSSITDPDRCELAHKTMLCSVEAAKKRGLNPKDMWDN